MLTFIYQLCCSLLSDITFATKIMQTYLKQQQTTTSIIVDLPSTDQIQEEEEEEEEITTYIDIEESGILNICEQ